jgi:hypothetical protein
VLFLKEETPSVCSADSPLKEGACPYGKPPSLREMSSECETKGVLFVKRLDLPLSGRCNIGT